NGYQGVFVKFNLDGDLLIEKYYEITDGTDLLKNITELSDRTFFLGGEVSGGELRSDGSIGSQSAGPIWMKVNDLGEVLWARRASYGYAFYAEQSEKAILLPDGDVLIAGYQSALIKLDSMGNIVWSLAEKKGNLFYKSIIPLSSKKYLVAGQAHDNGIKAFFQIIDVDTGTIEKHTLLSAPLFDIFLESIQNNEYGEIVAVGKSQFSTYNSSPFLGVLSSDLTRVRATATFSLEDHTTNLDLFKRTYLQPYAPFRSITVTEIVKTP
ncbi:MAG: hypothetical protein KDD34_08520, partial [Bdellovibrionales bacterium]|nr:hypothetical protein [Bdellovibrionales bacterium]